MGDVIHANFAKGKRSTPSLKADMTNAAQIPKGFNCVVFSMAQSPDFQMFKKLSHRNIKDTFFDRNLIKNMEYFQYKMRHPLGGDSDEFTVSNPSPIYIVGGAVFQGTHQEYVITRSGRRLPLTDDMRVLDKNLNIIWAPERSSVPAPIMEKNPDRGLL